MTVVGQPLAVCTSVCRSRIETERCNIESLSADWGEYKIGIYFTLPRANHLRKTG
jgi:hypothetical protein